METIRRVNRIRLPLGDGKKTFAGAVMIIALVLFFSASPSMAHETAQVKKVLLIHSFEPLLPYSIVVNQSIRSVFEEDKTIHADFYTENLDLARFPDEEYLRRLRDFLRHKYSPHSLDLIFVMLNPALDFVLKHEDALFPGVPVVFCGVEKRRDHIMKPNITGVLMDIDPKGTLDAALTLQPDTRKVVVIGGTNENDRAYETRTREALKEYEGRLEITHLTGESMDTVLRAVTRLPEHTIIFYISMFQDGAGKAFVPRDAAGLISRTSNVPVYGMFDSYLGHGIVGGCLVSFEEQGKKAATMGLSILHGRIPAGIPISKSPNIYKFDWRQMKRWGMSASRLPPHSVVAYEERGLWHHYKWLILGIIAFSALESALIFILLMQRVIRRRTEEALNASEEKHRSIIENAIEGIFQTSPEGEFLSANPALAAMFGFDSPEELMAAVKSIQDKLYVDSADRDRLKRLYEEQGYVLNFETRVYGKDGNILWISMTARAVKDGAGRIIRYEGTTENITERKRAEEGERLSRQRVLDIVEFLPDSTFVIDHERKVVAWNRAIEEMTGVRKDEIIGQGDYAYALPFYGERRPAAIDLVFGWNEESVGKYDFVEKQGDILIAEVYVPMTYRGKDAYLSVRASPLCDSRGNVVGAIESIRDVTEQKRIAAELQESEGRYRTAIESSSDGILMVKEGRYLYANRKFLDIFGFESMDAVVGQAVGFVTHPDDRERVVDIQKRRQRNEEAPSRYEFKGLRTNGDTIFLEASVARTAYKGEPISLAYVRDITARKHLEAQLRQSQKMEAIGTLAGGVAHDLNNILTVLMGYGTLLEMGLNTDNPLRSYADHILSSTRKAANLTQSLLTFSRQQPIALSPVGLNDILGKTEKLLARLLTEDITLITILSPQEIPVMADVTQIDQILFNLVANARDAMTHGGTIVMKTGFTEIDREFIDSHGFGKPGEYASLSVSDTGTGMDSATKEKIFDPFFTTKEVGKGTGLGLSTVYGIVKQHKGYIDVYSEPGSGTAFTIYLPAVMTAIGEEAPAARAPKRGNETILVAEDNEAVRNFLREILLQYGYTVVEAVDGADAVAKFKEHGHIDLLIIDSVMPKMNGREAYNEISGMRPGIKVLFTSGHTRDVVLDRGIEESKFNFISKPLLPNELLDKVREVLDK